MSISTEKAYEILHLPLGSPRDLIEQSYKKLAVKWHPSSNKNPEESFKKFKSISIAYRKLIFNDRDLTAITTHDLFEQFRQAFHPNDKKHHIELTDSQNKSQKTSGASVFGNEIPINSINKVNKSAVVGTSKYVNDKNNNNEENYENKNNVSSGRREDIKQKVKQLAVKGNEFAKQEEYKKAIDCFSDAIKYDTRDHRIYLNRSYCYEKLEMFNEALVDAESAIRLEPTWPKGYYRKGRALSGLKAYKEAEKSYEKVLEIENNLDDPELEEELIKVRAHQLMEMGFSKIHAEAAVKSFGSVVNALEAIFAFPEPEKSNESCSDIDYNELDLNENDSDNCEENVRLANIKIKSNNSTTSSSSNYSNSSNENKPFLTVASDTVVTNNNPPSTSLWIGNVDPCVSQNTLVELFKNNGHHIINVRCLPEKYCAFVNFKTKDESARAMQSLQGKPFHGQRLLIKYPDNQVTNNAYKPIKIGSTTLKKDPKKEAAEKAAVAAAAAAKKKAEASAKLSGPVNGNECYFWRTTGCIYGDKCKYDHVKKNKGIDKKPWQK